MRVNKLLASRGLASRREADRLLQNGWVRVDGRVAGVGDVARPDVDVELAPQAAALRREAVSVLLHKPYSFVSQTNEPKRRQRMARDLLTAEHQHRGCAYRGRDPAGLPNLAVAGRLDADSTGALVFSQDGVLKRAVIGGELRLEKEYLVTVKGAERWGATERGGCLARLRHGIVLDDRPLLPAQAEWEADDVLHITLTQGRFRQIRRMCEDVGLEVERLKRTRIGGLELGDLKSGMWRTFTLEELLRGQDDADVPEALLAAAEADAEAAESRPPPPPPRRAYGRAARGGGRGVGRAATGGGRGGRGVERPARTGGGGGGGNATFVRRGRRTES